MSCDPGCPSGPKLCKRSRARIHTPLPVVFRIRPHSRWTRNTHCGCRELTCIKVRTRILDLFAKLCGGGWRCWHIHSRGDSYGAREMLLRRSTIRVHVYEYTVIRTDMWDPYDRWFHCAVSSSVRINFPHALLCVHSGQHTNTHTLTPHDRTLARTHRCWSSTRRRRRSGARSR